MSEKTEQSHIVQLLRSCGARVYVLGHPSPRDGRTFRGTGQTPGIPDVEAFLCHPDTKHWQVLKVEVKAVGGRLRPEQATYRELCAWAGVAHIVGGLDAVIAWLSREGYVNPQQFPLHRQPLEVGR